MSASQDEESGTYRAKVDQQDGGPASHTEDASGGATNDVASGGVSEPRDEHDERDDEQNDESAGPTEEAEPGRDVHGDSDTVS
ncbi:MAG TPA: hypothetical protein VG502_02215 [Flexivirga sp.]|uniref:hypothetical protein n=1 Tax=Flexivirga sp. TaxID=1962927 RepID=UPI002CDAA278|nr:hypothetical protein [Flexivirga sp.]HWC21092.1 hypothetical protein [Flexivirga sp.]